MDEKTICIVRNRSSSRVCYVIPEEGIRREFAPGENKKIPYGELEKLSYQAGGAAMMTHFLQIKAPTAVEELNLHVEHEYNMEEPQIIDLIKNGSLDSFLDCLDFAPVGVIDLIKKYAVDLPMENVAKIDALKEKTGFDVVKARENLKAEAAEDGVKTAAAGRRVPVPTAGSEAPLTASETPARRTTPKYNVVG